MDATDRYSYSDSIWRYSLSTDEWRCIGRKQGAIDWPRGRAFHSMLYVRETESVLVMGGESDANDEDNDDNDDAVEVWSYSLRANRWRSHSSAAASSVTTRVDGEKKRNRNAPDARKSTSISLLRAALLPSSLSLTSSLLSSTTSSSSSSVHPHVLLFGGKLNTYHYRSQTSSRSICGDVDMNHRDVASNTILDKNDLWLYTVAASADIMREGALMDPSRVASADEVLLSPIICDDDNAEHWVLLSSGGCHAFDDGQTHDPIDIVAVVVLLLIVGSVLVGMYCHRFTLPYRGPPLLHPSSLSSVRRYHSVPSIPSNDEEEEEEEKDCHESHSMVELGPL